MLSESHPSRGLHSSVFSKQDGQLFHMVDLEVNDYPRNSAYNINIRTGQAKFRRHYQQLKKSTDVLERRCQSAKRKLNSDKFRIVSLIGHDPCPPDAHAEQILYPIAQPGFCYRANGEPRKCFNSLVESQTRRIVHDMEGSLGLIPKPAANVVSDNPTMSEVLSSPELVSILCDLRTTAALLADPMLARQFVLKFQYLSELDPSSILPLLVPAAAAAAGEKYAAPADDGAATAANGKNEQQQLTQLSPIDYLKQYRKNLLQSFFDVLQEKAEIRLSGGITKNAALRYLWAVPTKSFRSLGPNQRVLDANKPPISINEWNEALLASLEKTQHEPFELKYARSALTPSTTHSQRERVPGKKSPSRPGSSSSRAAAGVNNLPGPGKGILTAKKKLAAAATGTGSTISAINQENTNQKVTDTVTIIKPHVRFGGVQVQKLSGETGAQPQSQQTRTLKKASTPSIVTLKHAPEGSARGGGAGTPFIELTTPNRQRQQDEEPLPALPKEIHDRLQFDTFMSVVIKDIKAVGAAKSALTSIKHNNPARHPAGKSDGLLKLLQKPSLFTNLTEDDVTFYEFEGGKAEFKKLLAKQLHEAHKVAAARLGVGGTSTARSYHLRKHRNINKNLTDTDDPASARVDQNLLSLTELPAASGETYHPTTQANSSAMMLNQLQQRHRPISNDSNSNNPSSPPSTSGSRSNKATNNSNSSSYPSTYTGTSTGSKDGAAASGSEGALNCKSCPQTHRNIKTLHRLSCPACKAKLYQSCGAVRERDQRDQLQVETRFWKMPGRADDWTRRAAGRDIAGSKLLLTIPISGNKEGFGTKSSASASKLQLASAITSSKISKYIPRNSGTYRATSHHPASSKALGSSGGGATFDDTTKTPLLPGSDRLLTKALTYLPSKSVLGQALATMTGPSAAGVLGAGALGRKFSTTLMEQWKNEMNALAAASSGYNSTVAAAGGAGAGPAGGSRSTTTEDQFLLDKLDNVTTDIMEQRKARKLQTPHSWTLRISKLDIMKLRHEMEIEALALKLEEIAKKDEQ